MTIEALTTPKVFISYSWSNDDYQQWVIDLAKRLVHDGVEVKIDKWDLIEGHDKYVFMEQMVRADEIDKVLMLCDEKYQSRANAREGGVGDETQIISSNIYGSTQQEKFIPIVTERDQGGQSFLPSYLASRIYIDLSNDEIFEDGYEQLLRSIYKVPLHQKPQLGKMPSFLSERQVDHLKTSAIIRRMESLIDKHPNRLKSLSYDFTEKFVEALSELSIQMKEGSILDELVYEKIEATIPLRDDFTSMLRLLCDAEVLESDFIVDFFEKIFVFTEFREVGRFYESQFDHYKFLVNELYLHTSMILLEKKQYQVFAEIVNAEYYFDTTTYSGRGAQSIGSFRFYLYSLEERNKRLGLSKISLQAETIFTRAGKYGKAITETDLILYYISKTQNLDRGTWYPNSYIYFKHSTPIKFLSRLKSNRHFDAIKDIFSVSSAGEIKEKFNGIQYDRGYGSSFESIPTIQEFINPEVIATTL